MSFSLSTPMTGISLVFLFRNYKIKRFNILAVSGKGLKVSRFYGGFSDWICRLYLLVYG